MSLARDPQGDLFVGGGGPNPGGAGGPRAGRAIAVPERVQRARAEERPPPSTATQLRTVLVVLRELGIDVRDRRERDGLRRVDLPDRRASHADLLLAGRTVAQRLAQA